MQRSHRLGDGNYHLHGSAWQMLTLATGAVLNAADAFVYWRKAVTLPYRETMRVEYVVARRLAYEMHKMRYVSPDTKRGTVAREFVRSLRDHKCAQMLRR